MTGRPVPKMLTANRLSDGAVIYLTAAGTWTEALPEGAVLDTTEAEAMAEAAGQKAQTDLHLVGAYLMDVKLQRGVPAPVKMRESIRAAGPSVRLDLGKQAE